MIHWFHASFWYWAPRQIVTSRSSFSGFPGFQVPRVIGHGDSSHQVFHVSNVLLRSCHPVELVILAEGLDWYLIDQGVMVPCGKGYQFGISVKFHCFQLVRAALSSIGPWHLAVGGVSVIMVY
jgi:hypothetical protein